MNITLSVACICLHHQEMIDNIGQQDNRGLLVAGFLKPSYRLLLLSSKQSTY